MVNVKKGCKKKYDIDFFYSWQYEDAQLKNRNLLFWRINKFNKINLIKIKYVSKAST